MAVTQTVTYPFDPKLESAGSQRKAVSRYALAGTYVTGGFATTPNELGLACLPDQVEDITVKAYTPTAAAVVGGKWDATNQKIVLTTATGELANATSVASLVLEVVAYSQ